MPSVLEGLRETKELVSFIHQCQYQDLPEEVTAKTKLCILDAVGAALAAT